ncbi:MAG: phosphonate ABC transporter ATP-binding protein [Reinekea sp.]|nr:phosphonate ABC transporter ATP-binding protein [Reinekea sp.]
MTTTLAQPQYRSTNEHPNVDLRPTSAAQDIPAVIQIRSLNKTFNQNTHAIVDLDLSIQAGEMVALIGPSGSGKSTLLRHINALTYGDRTGVESDIQVFGQPTQQRGRKTRHTREARKKIGYIFQQFNLVNRLTVLTNVLIGSLGHKSAWTGSIGWFTKSEKQLAMQALARVGMDSFAFQRASTLSGGQQQRVAIARALMQRADIILADEPIASLDPVSAKKVMEILKSIHEDDGKTVVVTLHQVNYAKAYCQRAVALKKGRLYFDGSAQDLSEARLNALYEGNDIKELLEDQIPESEMAFA